MEDEEIPLLSRKVDEEDEGNKGEDEMQETSFGGGNVERGARGSGARPKTRTSSHANPSYEVEEGNKLILEFADERQDEAKRRIQEEYPDWDPAKSKFVATINDKGQTEAALIKGKTIDSTKKYVLFKEDGTLRRGLPKAILESLGKTTSEIIDGRDEEIEELRMRIEGEKSLREGVYRKGREERRKLKEKIKEGEEKISALEDEKDDLLNQAKKDFEAKLERFGKDNEAIGKERDKFYNDDEMSNLKENYDERVREITNVYEERIREGNKQISNLSKELRRMQMSMEDLNEELTEKNKTLSAEDQRILEESEMRIEENEERIDELTRENEATLERLSLRERVKLIFKKYGVTALGIITAVGTVIGVIVSNLKSGLAKVAKGVGDGLKELGKKLAQLLPGMIGAIAKYIFNTAGEVVGYLAKNTWLLIVAAVVYAVDQFKKKNKWKKNDYDYFEIDAID